MFTGKLYPESACFSPGSQLLVVLCESVCEGMHGGKVSAWGLDGRVRVYVRVGGHFREFGCECVCVGRDCAEQCGNKYST